MKGVLKWPGWVKALFIHEIVTVWIKSEELVLLWHFSTRETWTETRSLNGPYRLGCYAEHCTLCIAYLNSLVVTGFLCYWQLSTLQFTSLPHPFAKSWMHLSVADSDSFIMSNWTGNSYLSTFIPSLMLWKVEKKQVIISLRGESQTWLQDPHVAATHTHPSLQLHGAHFTSETRLMTMLLIRIPAIIYSRWYEPVRPVWLYQAWCCCYGTGRLGLVGQPSLTQWCVFMKEPTVQSLYHSPLSGTV